MNKLTAIMGAAAIAAGFVGCTPDKVIVTIPTSAVQKSQAGEVGYASAKITYSVMDNDGKKHLAKCKEVAAKYVGEGGTVDLSGGLDPADSNPAYLTATFSMPICTPQNKDKVKFVPPAVLWLENGALTFNACVKRLNEELKKIQDCRLILLSKNKLQWVKIGGYNYCFKSSDYQMKRKFNKNI